MTKTEFVRALEEDEEVISTIKLAHALYEKLDAEPIVNYQTLGRFEKLHNYVNDHTTEEVKAFLLRYYSSIKASYKGFVDNRTRNRMKADADMMDYDDITRDIYEDVKDSALKAIVLPYTFRKERERRNNMTFDEDSQAVKLDMFSLQLFKNYVKNRKRKLSGKDCLKYLSIIPRAKDEAEGHIRAKYIKILWDNASTRSLAFIEKLRWERYRPSTPGTDRPFYTLVSNTHIISDYSEHVTMSYNYTYSVASNVGLPLRTRQRGITESQLFVYITGVERKSEMTEADVLHAIDKLIVLVYQQKQNPSCKYYQMLIDQIKSELTRDDNKVVVSKIFVKSKIIHAQLEVDTYLNQITGQ